MSELWRLSPSSCVEMKRLVTAGNRDKHERNKWLEEFRHVHDFGPLYELLKQTGESLDKQDENPDQNPPQIDPHEEFLEAIENEPVTRFDYMLEEGSKNVILFEILAERLSAGAVEAFCKHLFTTDLKVECLDNLYEHFFPIYLKRPYTWFSLDILVKAHKAHPLQFNILLKTLLQDTDICNTLLNDFVFKLDDAGKYEFLTTAMELEFTELQFTHHLISIYSAYKGSEKSEHIQTYIYQSLLKYATHCLSDWNYGRLLLLYLQTVSSMDGTLDFIMVERLIQMHRSSFKRPCLTLLSEMVKSFYEKPYPNPT